MYPYIYNDAVCCSEQILEAAFYKAIVVWPLTSDLTNHPKKVELDILSTNFEVMTKV